MKILIKEVIPELNKIQERLDLVVCRKITNNIYSRTNSEGVLMQSADAYTQCLKLRINKLRVMMEEDLKVWEDAVV